VRWPNPSQAAGELVALHVLNYLAGSDVHALPPYATAFHPGRYRDPEFLKSLAATSGRNGQL